MNLRNASRFNLTMTTAMQLAMGEVDLGPSMQVSVSVVCFCCWGSEWLINCDLWYKSCCWMAPLTPSYMRWNVERSGQFCERTQRCNVESRQIQAGLSGYVCKAISLAYWRFPHVVSITMYSPQLSVAVVVEGRLTRNYHTMTHDTTGLSLCWCTTVRRTIPEWHAVQPRLRCDEAGQGTLCHGRIRNKAINRFNRFVVLQQQTWSGQGPGVTVWYVC